MASTFPLELVTPERLLFSEEVNEVIAPGVEGTLGVLAGHAPLLTELRTGLIVVKLPNGTVESIATSGGFLQISHSKVIILADAAERSSEIDVERARVAAAKARQMLDVPGSGIDTEVVRAELERAQNRLKVAQQL